MFNPASTSTLTAGTLTKCGRNVTTQPHYHAGIQAVRACFNGENPPMYTRTGELIGRVDDNPHSHKIENSSTPQPKDPSPKQIKYYNDLTAYLQLPNNINDFHAGNISDELNRLIAIRSNLTHQQRAQLNANNSSAFANSTHSTPAQPRAPRIEVTEGLWVLDNDPNKIFKVQRAVHGSGFLYVKQFYPFTKSFRKLNGGLRTLSTYLNATPARIRPLTAEEAAEFGHLYGMCVNCGRTLTDEVSISDGYGPTCAANNGWPRNRQNIPE